MDLTRWKVADLGIALVTCVLAFGALERAGAADHPGFTMDQVLLEPDSQFLTIRAHGGMTSEERSYSLRGDGLLTIFSTTNASATPQLVYTEQLSDEEVGAAVEAILSATLYEYDQDQVRAKHRTEPNPGSSIDDAGSLEVEIHLPLFPGTNLSGSDELSHVFGVNGSDMAEGRFPNISEYAALRQILGGFRRAERRARAAEMVR